MRIFEYNLRPKHVELIVYLNAVAFKDVYLFEQASDEILTKERMDLELLLRYNGEAAMARLIVE